MFCFHETIEKKEVAPGVTLQVLGRGDQINAVHWDFADGAVAAVQEHPQEQFGYVIQGSFRVTIGDETVILKAGDSYYVPANVPHAFVAIGATEAIDVFTPVRLVGEDHHK
jgi:quercetin dioxygenase-like cupin family protein